jgi:hypothetical protein
VLVAHPALAVGSQGNQGAFEGAYRVVVVACHAALVAFRGVDLVGRQAYLGVGSLGNLEAGRAVGRLHLDQVGRRDGVWVEEEERRIG